MLICRRTALTLATENKLTETVKVLLAHGATEPVLGKKFHSSTYTSTEEDSGFGSSQHISDVLHSPLKAGMKVILVTSTDIRVAICL